MESTLSQAVEDKKKLYKLVSTLGLATISCNLVSGSIAVFFGLQNKSLALTVFGLNSLIGIIYGLGISNMTWTRARNYPEIDTFATILFSIAGRAYYALMPALAIIAGVNIFNGTRPEEAFWGVITPVCFMPVMLFLDNYKTKIARQHIFPALLADTNLTSSAYIYPSVILFLSSIAHEVLSISLIDAAGAFGIAVSACITGKTLLRKIA